MSNQVPYTSNYLVQNTKSIQYIKVALSGAF